MAIDSHPLRGDTPRALASTSSGKAAFPARGRIGQDRLSKTSAIIAILFLTFLAMFKDDQTSLNAALAGLSVNPYVAALKSASNYALIPFCAFAALSLGASRQRSFFFAPSLFLPSLILIIAALRGLGVNSELGYKTLASSIIFFGMGVYCCALLGTIGAPNYRRALGNALLASSLLLVWCNFFNLVTGFGFLGTHPRLFGTTSHPNFLGVQLATANILLAGSIPAGRRMAFRMFLVISITVGLYLQFKTGSRTALMMTVVGISAWIWARQRFQLGLAVLFGILILAAVSFFIASGPELTQGTAFDRGFGSGDTRSAAIGELLDSIASDPFWGRGSFSGASENSYLRGWAAYGLVYEFFFIAFISKVFVSGIRRILRTNDVLETSIFLALVFALAAGGMLEGYMVDNFSYPALLFFLCFTGLVGGDQPVDKRTPPFSRHRPRETPIPSR